MDVLAVYRAVSDAAARARAGGGPSLVVCVTYRYFGHHVGDPLNYRDKAEVDAWRQRDPIERFEQTLIGCGAISADAAVRLGAEVAAEIESAVAFAKASPEPEVAALMEDVYA